MLRQHVNFRLVGQKGVYVCLAKKEYVMSKTIFQNDHCFFELITRDNQNFIVGLIYFNPKLEDDIWRRSLNAAFDQVNSLKLKCPIIVGGDFNGRVGEINQVNETIVSECFANLVGERRFMDKKINMRGRLLVENFEERAFFILNGRTREDNPACFTYCGQRGNSVVDLVFCNFEFLHCIANLCVMPLVTRSDHLPVTLSLELVQNKIVRRENPAGRGIRVGGLKWKENLGEEYMEKMILHQNVQWKGGSTDRANDCLVSVVTYVAGSLGMRRTEVGAKRITFEKRVLEVSLLICQMR